VFSTILEGIRSIFSFITVFGDWVTDTSDWLWESFNDFILDWGDWLVAWLWAIVTGIVNFIVVSFVWRFITVIFISAFYGAAARFFQTGIAIYFLAWFWSAAFRLLGIGFVLFNTWSLGLIPNVELMFMTGLDLVPASFQPMLIYMGVPDAFHFIFSVYLAFATIKVGRWVFGGPHFLS